MIFACTVVFVFSLVPAGCYNLERAQLEAELQQARREIDELRMTLDTVEQWPQQTGEAVAEVGAEVAGEAARAPSQLQQQIDEFMKVRDALQQRQDELAQLRQAALVEAETAQTLMDDFAAQLRAEMEKVNRLQDELQQAQQAITELQRKLE